MSLDPILLEEALESRRLYELIMQEVKSRLTTIRIISASGTGLPSTIAQETCYLQIRFICELIAIGCLVAHGDINETKTRTLQRAYQPEKIIRSLERLHPDFFPIPAELIQREGHIEILLHNPQSVFTKNDLLEVWGKCGDYLHKGGLLKSLSPARRSSDDYTEISDWYNKLCYLVSFHIIARKSNTPITCALNEDKSDAVEVNVLSTMPPSGVQSRATR